MPEKKTEFQLHEDGDSWGDLVKRVKDPTEYKEFRDAIDKFISDNFEKGVHHGPPYKGTDKWTLLQPGAQMLAELTNTRAMYFPDLQTWDMLGKTGGVVCYVCYLVPQSRLAALAEMSVDLGVSQYKILCKSYSFAEGRGAGNVKHERESMQHNSVAKKVQKRAFVDAIMRLCGLYARYTQDMDDEKDTSAAEVLDEEDGERAIEATDADFLGDDDSELPARDLDESMGNNSADTEDDLF